MDYCSHCSQRVNDALLCGKCKNAVYCSGACQLAAWNGGHSQLCVPTPDEPARSANEDVSQVAPPEQKLVKGWACEYGCGFTGTFHEVGEHEKGCHKQPGKPPLDTSNQPNSENAMVAAPVPPPRRTKSFQNSGSFSGSVSNLSSPRSMANVLPNVPNTPTWGVMETGSQMHNPQKEWLDPSSTGNDSMSACVRTFA